MDEWKLVELDKLCRIVGGGTPSKKNASFYDGHLPWATVRDMKNDIIEDTELKITEEGIKRSSTNIIPAGNVVIATRVGLGKACFVNQDTAINQDLKGIIPKDGNVLPRFLFWWFKRMSDEIIKAGTGATVQGVKLPFIKSLLIPKIPVIEQQRLVENIEKAFAAIDKAKANIEKNIENAKELFQSKLNEIFSQQGEGWKERKLKEIISISHGYAFKSKDFDKDYTGDNPIVLTPGNFSENSELYFNEKNTKRYSGRVPENFLFNKKDLAVVMTDLSSKMKILGKPSFIESNNILHNQRIGRIIFKEDDLLKELLYYYFQSAGYLQEVRNTSTGTMVRHTAPSRILSCIISFPASKEKQSSLIDELNSLKTSTRNLENIYQNKLNNLEELKKSILQKAFAGKLTQKEIEV